MTCSIIIRSFNEERHIGRLITGINKQVLSDLVQIEILLVDSGSTDSTVSIARNMGAKVISISKEEFSFGRALNIGCKNACGEYFLFASAHVYPLTTDWIMNMISPFFNNNKIGLVYGRQIGDSCTAFSEKQIFSKWFPLTSDRNQLTPFCNNANCIIPKKLWLIQNYDEILTGLEDLDWAKKIMSKGYKIIYEASAVIIHVHDESPKKTMNRYRREAIALKKIMPKVHVNFLNFVFLFFSNLITDFFHAFKQGVYFKEAKEIVIFRFMQFYGIYLGHKDKGSINNDLKSRFYYPNTEGLNQKKLDLRSNISSKKFIKYDSP